MNTRRYFLEVAYKGTNYSGFQIQDNANTIQGEVERALSILYKQSFELTGSSRTDAGVHALQNFFHFDTNVSIEARHLYNLNALLPSDIAASAIYEVAGESHCRFSALSRQYKYYIYFKKDPFLNESAFYYPYKLDIDILSYTAQLVKENKDFSSFSKRNVQVKTFSCDILDSVWSPEGNCLVYNVTANRFLRGMVRALVGTMLKTARGTLSIDEFKKILNNINASGADFSPPAKGLFLIQVNYLTHILTKTAMDINNHTT